MRTIIPLFIVLTILQIGCAPPWYGEECNYSVAVVSFSDQDNNLLLVDSLGYTEVRQIERDRVIDQSAWSEIEEMDFRRHQPETQFLLPLDPEASQSTFVFYHPNGNDTLVVQYDSRLRYRRNACGYNYSVHALDFIFNGEPVVGWKEVNHPRIAGEAEVRR